MALRVVEAGEESSAPDVKALGEELWMASRRFLLEYRKAEAALTPEPDDFDFEGPCIAGYGRSAVLAIESLESMMRMYCK